MQRCASRPFVVVTVLAIGVMLLFQCWRFHFNLNDDNLSQWVPLFYDIGRNLWSGNHPYISQCIFGGNYPILLDPNFLCYGNPVNFALAALTPHFLGLWVADAMVGVQILGAAVSFMALALRLRAVGLSKISNGWCVFCSLSYAFCGHAVILPASWAYCSHIVLALPLALVGLLDGKLWRGVLIFSLAIINSVLGYLHNFLYSLPFYLGIAIILSWALRSHRPWRIMLLGGLLAMEVTAPILAHSVIAFHNSPRALFNDPHDLYYTSFSPVKFLLSATTGGLVAFEGSRFQLFELHPRQVYALYFFTGSLCFWAAFAASIWRPSVLRIGLALLMVLAAFFVTRDQWLYPYMVHVPLYRYLRWPMREGIFYVFFANVYLVCAAHYLKPLLLRRLAIAGSLLLVWSLFSKPGLTFNSMTGDYDLVLSGKAARYWERLKPQLPPGSRVAAFVNEPKWDPCTDRLPHVLAGSFNYSCIYNFNSVSSYCYTRIDSGPLRKIEPFHWSGLYSLKDMPVIKKIDPNLTCMIIDGLDIHGIWIQCPQDPSPRPVLELVGKLD